MREVAGLTQEELASRAGLSPNAVGVLERGRRRRPYPHTVRALADTLGLDEDGRSELLAAVPGRGEATRAAAQGPSTAELPHPATALVGRERELAELAGLLGGGDRLLTLTGIGGVGKTRLATEAAREAAPLFPDGVAFVGLAPLRDHLLVFPTVARALGLRETEGQTPHEVLRGHLREKSFLLVLDNFERVLDAAPEVGALIEACPGLTVLTTSRAPLRVRGEREYPVSPLELPPSTRNPTEEEVLKAPSGRLFLERARASNPSFVVTEENAAAVAAICWRLAGLPLALELAAAKVRFLDPASLLSHLDGALSGAWARDLPERQRTMRAALDWSHELLSEEERVLFRRLAVFAGGFTLEAAEGVCALGRIEPGGVFEPLGRLVEQSLVTVDHDAGGLRYGMLEPVRQYALEKLGESGEAEEVRRRHAEHFVAFAEAAAPRLMGPEHAAWLERLEQEHDNLREALRWARETGRVETGLRLVGALYWFWWMHGYLGEGRRWVEEFLSGSEGCGPGPARAMALYGAGEMALGQGDPVRAVALLEESLALYRELGDEVGVAIVLSELGQATRAQGDHDRAAALSEEGLACSRELGERNAAAIALNTLGHIERQRGELASATARHEESLTLFGEARNERGVAYTLSNLGVAALERGDLERASALYRESLSRYEGLGDNSGVALVLAHLGDVARERGDQERATALYNDALALHRELGNERGAARVLARLAALRPLTGG
jgi:predicted ATPase/DNA-binding XRE family transcriptional regulator